MKSNILIARSLEVIDSLDRKGIKTPLLIMSSPGFGKTTTVEMWCNLKGYNLTTLIASQYSQDDILGIQAVSNGRLQRLTPAWFNAMLEKAENKKRNVLFIDELTTCDEFLQAPLLNLIFARNLGLHSLPDNTLIVTAGNYSEELNGVFSLTAPLVNRFIILNLNQANDFDIEEVVEGRLGSLGTDEDRIEYLGLKQEEVSKWDAESLGKFIVTTVPFGKSEIRNNANLGLLGFPSVRSIHNSINFYKQWISLYDSEDWTRIVGDTLGTVQRDKGTMLIRELLSVNSGYFLSTKKKLESIRGEFDKELQNLVVGTNPYETVENLKSLLIHQGISEQESLLLDRVKNVNSYTREIADFVLKNGSLIPTRCT